MASGGIPAAPAAPPPGWYPDPTGAGDYRYWDGRAWTLGVATGGQVSERPLTGPVRAPDQAESRPWRAPLPSRALVPAALGWVLGVVAAYALGRLGLAVGLPLAVVVLLVQAGLWSPLLAACSWASRRFGSGRVLSDFGLRLGWPDVGWGLLMSLAARVAAVIVIVPFVLWGQRYLGADDRLFRILKHDSAAFVAAAVIAVLGAPLVEELFFRGLLQRSLTSALRPAGGVVAQSALFGLAHVNPVLGVTNFSVVAVIAAAGVVFGATAWWRGLGGSAMAHSFFNVLPVVVALTGGPPPSG